MFDKMPINGISYYPATERGKKLIKTHHKNFLLPLALCMGLTAVLVGPVSAGTFTLLHSFPALNNKTNSDGASPVGELILSGATLYGTALYGGVASNGVVYALNTDGTGFTNLYSFAGGQEGANPRSGLVLSGGALYGITVNGGTNGFGTIFKINANGSGFTNLYTFSGGRDGGYPSGGLVLSANKLYGTAYYGGASGNGTVFAINTDGTGFTNLYNFTALNNKTNSDGSAPLAGLLLSGDMLYGTTFYGGTSGSGTVFALTTNGTDFTNLYSFTDGSDGANPVGRLVLSGNTLYGTAEYGGSATNGTVFALSTSGSGFQLLHSFTALNNFTNQDGANPYAGLHLSGSTLYGTALLGGAGSGTIFSLSTNGSGFTNLYTFSAMQNFTNRDGANPASPLLLSGSTLYGTTEYGGASGKGTVFSLSLAQPSPPSLTITRSGDDVILTWPADATGFTLQSSTNLVTPFWTTVSPAPVVLNSLNTVTNPISRAGRFYRLSQ